MITLASHRSPRTTNPEGRYGRRPATVRTTRSGETSTRARLRLDGGPETKGEAALPPAQAPFAARPRAAVPTVRSQLLRSSADACMLALRGDVGRDAGGRRDRAALMLRPGMRSVQRHVRLVGVRWPQPCRPSDAARIAVHVRDDP